MGNYFFVDKKRSTIGNFVNYIQLVGEVVLFFCILTDFLSFCSVGPVERGVEVSNSNCEFLYDFLSALSVFISCILRLCC